MNDHKVMCNLERYTAKESVKVMTSKLTFVFIILRIFLVFDRTDEKAKLKGDAVVQTMNLHHHLVFFKGSDRFWQRQLSLAK